MDNMINFDELYKRASTIKKPKKQEAYNYLKELTIAINNNDTFQIEFNLHKLISFFNPSVPSKPKTLFDYAAKIAALSAKDVRTYLKYIKVDEDKCIATNGHIMVVVDNEEQLVNGLYYYTRIKSDEESYPEYKRVLKSIENTYTPVSIDIEFKGDNQFFKINDSYFDYKYVELITCFDKHGEWEITGDNRTAVYYFEGGYGLVMSINKD